MPERPHRRSLAVVLLGALCVLGVAGPGAARAGDPPPAAPEHDAGVSIGQTWERLREGGQHLWARVQPGPRSPLFRPRAREGWQWERGYLHQGRWVPGEWLPLGEPPTADAVWAPGHWEGRTWVDGRWRVAAREGYAWVEGYVDADGLWVDGRWQELGRVVQVHASPPPLEGLVAEPSAVADGGGGAGDGAWR